MIQKTLIELKCIKQGNIYGHAGKELHANFFSALESLNSVFAQKLHDEKIKPFAIGPLVGNISRNSGVSSVFEGEKYTFSISTFTEEISNSMDRILDHMQKKLFTIGKTSYEVISSRLMFEKATPFMKLIYNREDINKLVFKFLSPTCFRNNGMLNLLPTPSLVFGGLLERWNRFSETPLPDIDFNCIIITRYDLKTNTVDFNNYKLVGFRGNCEYAFAPDASKMDIWAINTLANFATISGVGYKTTMGMGQVKTET